MTTKPKFMTWSANKLPDQSVMAGPPWRDWVGKYLCEGDSNIHFMNVRWAISPDAYNIGQGGDVPGGVITQFNAEVKPKFDRGEIKVEKAYIQIGANRWGSVPLEVVQLNTVPFENEMRTIMNLYKTILPAKNIVIASHPYTAPWLRITDWPTTKVYDEKTREAMNKFSANAFFRMVNNNLIHVCKEEGVKYLDIFTPLEEIWRTNYSECLLFGKQKQWEDEVHYSPQVGMIVGQFVRNLWGI